MSAKVLSTYDGKSYRLTEEQAAQVFLAVNAGKKMLTIATLSGLAYVAPSNIRGIDPAPSHQGVDLAERAAASADREIERLRRRGIDLGKVGPVHEVSRTPLPAQI